MTEFELRGPFVEHRDDGIIFGKYEPGNGTSYQALVVPTRGEVGCGWLGGLDNNGWLVVSGMVNCRAYLLPKGAHLDYYYIASKFDLRNGEDIKYFVELLEAMLREG